MMDVSTKFLENPHGFGELCGYIDDINTFAEYAGVSEIPIYGGVSVISNSAKVLGIIR